MELLFYLCVKKEPALANVGTGWYFYAKWIRADIVWTANCNGCLLCLTSDLLAWGVQPRKKINNVHSFKGPISEYCKSDLTGCQMQVACMHLAQACWCGDLPSPKEVNGDKICPAFKPHPHPRISVAVCTKHPIMSELFLSENIWSIIERQSPADTLGSYLADKRITP